MKNKPKKLTRRQFEQAAKECATAGCDPSKSWAELSPEARAALKTHQESMVNFIFGTPEDN